MKALIRFEDLEIPALTVIAQEQYEECLWAIEKALDKQLAFGRLLRIVKEKLPHGEWGTWVRETFTDHKSLRTIQRYMRGADSIATDPSLLECADSLDGILKIVEERKPAVEVTEPAASVPDVAEYIADSVTAEDVLGIASENAAVETVKPETDQCEDDPVEIIDDVEEFPEDETMAEICQRETSEIESWARKFGDMLNEAQKALSAVPTLDELNARGGWERKLKEALATLRGTKPVVCPICQGDGGEKCPCRGHGRITKRQHGQMV